MYNLIIIGKIIKICFLIEKVKAIFLYKLNYLGKLIQREHL
jgi:hypothetical protein